MTYHRFPAVLSILVTAIVSGCATLNKEECLQADWHLIGFEDGTNGRPAGYLGEHRSACAEYGVVPDQGAYLAGRAEGLKEYCTPYQGFQVGLRGGSYAGVCPPASESGFLSGYDYGKRIHEKKQQLDDVEKAQAQAKATLEDVKQQQAEIERQLIAPETPTEERARLLTQAKALAKQQGETEQQLKELERQHTRLSDRIEQLRARSPY